MVKSDCLFIWFRLVTAQVVSSHNAEFGGIPSGRWGTPRDSVLQMANLSLAATGEKDPPLCFSSGISCSCESQHRYLLALPALTQGNTLHRLTSSANTFNSCLIIKWTHLAGIFILRWVNPAFFLSPRSPGFLTHHPLSYIWGHRNTIQRSYSLNCQPLSPWQPPWSSTGGGYVDLLVKGESDIVSFPPSLPPSLLLLSLICTFFSKLALLWTICAFTASVQSLYFPAAVDRCLLCTAFLYAYHEQNNSDFSDPVFKKRKCSIPMRRHIWLDKQVLLNPGPIPVSDWTQES